MLLFKKLRLSLVSFQAAALLVCALSLSACTHVFFQPTRELYFPPEKFRIPYREHFFNSLDGKNLHGWYFYHRSKRPSKGLVVQFHGNGENISSFYTTLVWLTQHDYDLFSFDYRGYGRSQGEPDQKGVNGDCIAAMTFAQKLWQENAAAHHTLSVSEGGGLILYGQSLGGALLLRAFHEAKVDLRKDVRAMVIDSSFVNYKNLAAEKLSDFWLTWPFQWLAYLLVSNGYSPKEYVPEISPIPLLVIHGAKDPVVPFHHGREIFDLAKEPKTFWEIPDGEHIDSMTAHGGIYQKKLLKFFDEVQAKR